MFELIHKVCGIEGTFRVTCEITMSVLRNNRESLLAVLEALVYDPLINWRLAQSNEYPTVDRMSIPCSNLGPTSEP